MIEVPLFVAVLCACVGWWLTGFVAIILAMAFVLPRSVDPYEACNAVIWDLREFFGFGTPTWVVVLVWPVSVVRILRAWT